MLHEINGHFVQGFLFRTALWLLTWKDALLLEKVIEKNNNPLDKQSYHSKKGTDQDAYYDLSNNIGQGKDLYCAMPAVTWTNCKDRSNLVTPLWEARGAKDLFSHEFWNFNWVKVS